MLCSVVCLDALYMWVWYECAGEMIRSYLAIYEERRMYVQCIYPSNKQILDMSIVGLKFLDARLHVFNLMRWARDGPQKF